jgi:uncharacterized protein YneF (UPF0154 family)
MILNIFMLVLGILIGIYVTFWLAEYVNNKDIKNKKLK